MILDVGLELGFLMVMRMIRFWNGSSQVDYLRIGNKVNLFIIIDIKIRMVVRGICLQGFWKWFMKYGIFRDNIIQMDNQQIYYLKYIIKKVLKTDDQKVKVSCFSGKLRLFSLQIRIVFRFRVY